MTIEHEINIVGAGKGGGGAHTPVEYPNTLKATQTLLVLGALCEGPISAIKNVYFDDTSIADYPGATYKTRMGESSQTSIKGFSNVESVITVGANLLASQPVARDVTATTVDAMAVTILINTLTHVEDDGDMVGYTVKHRIETRVNSGASWVNWDNGNSGIVSVSGKAMSPYPVTFEIERPGGADGQIWGVRITRLTQNDPSSKYQSTASWSITNEIQYKNLTYNDTALVAITADAQSTGGKAPRVSVEGDWQKIFVPNNYNPTTRTYSGTWNGGLTAGRVFSNNPAWIIYDILTNTRYGMGIAASRIDLYSFYNAGVYNDGFVSYYDSNTSTTKTEPRFQFNGVVQTWENDWQLIQILAATFHAAILDIGGQITCIQDRPTTMTSIFTNANVIDGIFEYTGNALQERHTVVNVTYNDPADRYKQRITTVEADSTYMNKYGYNSTEIAILGCTSEGQAMRSGKWLLESELATPETVVFRVGVGDAYLQPGQVIGVMDNDYAATTQGGRISTVNSTSSVTLDRAITLPAGTSTITCILADGVTIETRNVTQASGSFTTLTTSTAFSQLPMNAQPFVVSTSSAAVRPFRVDRLTLYTGSEKLIMEVQAAFYDENKWARVEGGLTLPAKQFSDINQAASNKPKNGTIKIVGVTEPITNATWNNMIVSWEPGDVTNAYSYKIDYTLENGQLIENDNVNVPNFTIEDIKPGYYKFWIYARNAANVLSPVYNLEYVFGSSNQPDAPPAAVLDGTLSAPTAVYVKGTTGTTFNTQDCVMVWNDTNLVSSTTPTLMNYRIEIWDSGGATLKHTYEAYTKEFVYTYAMNTADFGTPKRSFQARLYCVDTRGKASSATIVAFNNPAPAQQSVSIISGSDVVSFNFTTTPEADHKGYVIHRSTTAGFTPAPANNIYNGPDSSVMLPATPGTTYYYKVAAYDTFGQDSLNYSADATSKTMSQKGYDYSYVGLTFTPTPATNTVSWTAGYANVVVNDTSTTYAINAGSWVSGGWGYIYYQVGTNVLSVTTDFGVANIAGRNIVAVYRGGSDLQVGNGKPIIDGSTIIAATVGAAQLKTNEAIITGTAQIANSIITNAHIQNGVIDNAKIGNVIQSTNYAPNSTGWKLDKNAGLEINGGNFTLRNNVGDVILSTTGEVQGEGSAGGNLLANANFAASIVAGKGTNRARPANWTYGYSDAPGTNVWAAVWDEQYWGAYGPVGVMWRNNYNVGTDHHDALYQDVQIQPGKWYEASCYTGTHRCRTFIQVQWLNADRSAGVGSMSSSINQNLASFGGTYSDTVRLFVAGEAPTNAHWARFVIYKYATDAGQNDSYGFYGRAMLARCRKNQTTPSEWQTTGGMNGIGSINSANMSTFIESASIGAAQIGNLQVGRIHIADRSVTDIISQTKSYQLIIPKTTKDYTNDYAVMNTYWDCPQIDAPYRCLCLFSTGVIITNASLVDNTKGSSYWVQTFHQLLQSSDGGVSWGVVENTKGSSDVYRLSVADGTTRAGEHDGGSLASNISFVPTPGYKYRLKTSYSKKNKALNGNAGGQAEFDVASDICTHIFIPYWK
jgi:predicted phage tail protein